ncbi:hypothetical protein C8Q77DRAFT_1220168 [Trametes polyzona]|nr:hypothetical protein C8Q77DRAFT_1220168 [Trametes polyzona]
MTRPKPGTLCPVSDAPHPFNQSSADLILRTADMFDFRVHSPILAQSSPFFASMFALPQPKAPGDCQAPADARLEVVPVSEDSATLELLLLLVYPVRKPHERMQDPAAIVPVVHAAKKYEMELPIDLLSERLVAVVQTEPLQVWAAACQAGLEDVARQAAEILAKQPKKVVSGEVESLGLACANELGNMDDISAGHYLRLKQFLSQADEKNAVPMKLLSAPDPSGQQFDLRAEGVRPPLFSTALPDCDVICRPSERGAGSPAPFLAHKVILSMHSPVLQARIAGLNAAQPRGSHPYQPPPTARAVTVLDFEEDHEVVSGLLRACYLGEDGGLPQDLEYLAQLLAASRKYEMARAEPCVRAAWDKAADASPLEAYFFAITYNLKDCAKAAARSSLKHPTSVATAYVSVMDRAPALAYHRLLLYHDACRRAVQARIDEACRDVQHWYPERREPGTKSTRGHAQVRDAKLATVRL